MKSGMIALQVNFKPNIEDKIWVAECPEIDLVTQGDTYEEAEKNLKKARNLFPPSSLKRKSTSHATPDASP